MHGYGGGRTVTCKEPIGLEALVAYWLGEVSARREAMLESHIFGCAHCSGRLEELAMLAAGVRAAVKDGMVSLVVCAPFVDAMRRAGLCLREYHLDPGASVNCSIRADDDAVIARIRAPLAGVKRLDVVSTQGAGESEQRLADVPFDAGSGEVLVMPSAAWLKTMPAFTTRMRLIAVDATGDRPIGDYTFNHSPS
ncbi:MAG: zf-HC2 domain-containing protein [Betaproteobacteria bacterium]|nr:zf-HC2 domain-containing protein [Betaproteobacteria bacterium]